MSRRRTFDAIPGQMALDLFPREIGDGPLSIGGSVDLLVERGCPEAVVRPAVETIYRSVRHGAYERAMCLGYFYGNRAIPNLVGRDPGELGIYDAELDYHAIWDRCWAARWVAFDEAVTVASWDYNYRKPYTGAPAFIWYVDNDGREVKRPYEEVQCEG